MKTLMNLTDHPFSMPDSPTYNYFGLGDLAKEVARLEPGITAGEDLITKRNLDKFLDVTNTTTQALLNLNSADLICDSYQIHTILAHLARSKGFLGLIWPSPRVPGGKIAIVFK